MPFVRVFCVVALLCVHAGAAMAEFEFRVVNCSKGSVVVTSYDGDDIAMYMPYEPPQMLDHGTYVTIHCRTNNTGTCKIEIKHPIFALMQTIREDLCYKRPEAPPPLFPFAACTCWG